MTVPALNIILAFEMLFTGNIALREACELSISEIWRQERLSPIP